MSIRKHYIAWCITGGGANLRGIVDVMLNIKQVADVKVTVFFTKWGFEVARIFGVLPRIKMIASGGYYEEILVGDEGMYFVGRLNRGSYKVLVIAPATSNSVAKFVYGISDSIASTLFSQALKSRVPAVVLPTDIPNESGVVETETPCYIDRDLCKIVECMKCPLIETCPVKAIKLVDGVPRIDLKYCIGCEKCVSVCPFKAVKCWEKVYITPTPIDITNIEMLKSMRNVYVVSTPKHLYDTVMGMLKT